MTSFKVKPNLASLLLTICTLILIWLVSTAYSYIDIGNIDGVRLGRAIEKHSNKVVTLPVINTNRNDSVSQYSYLFSYDIVSLPDEPQYIYLPRFEQNIEVKVNNRRLPGIQLKQVWSGPFTFNSALEEIPNSSLFVGKNEIEVTVISGSLPPNSLYQVYVGTWQNLSPHYYIQNFLEHELRWITFFVILMIAIVSFAFAIKLPEQTEFFWLSISLSCTLIYRVGLFTPFVPSIVEAVPHLFLLAAPLASSSAIAFSLSISGYRAKPKWVMSSLLISGFALTLELSGFIDPRTAAIKIVAPFFLAGLLVSGLIIANSFFRKSNNENGPLLPGIILVAAGTFHDILVIRGSLHSVYLLAYISILALLIALLFFLMKRITSMAHKLKTSERTLQIRLEQREEQLKTSFDERRKLLEMSATNKERERITQELHDGVAGQLTTVIALSEMPDGNEQVRQAAKYALDDLRTIIDAFSNIDNDPYVLLSAVKERYFDPLHSTGIELFWNLEGLPKELHFSPDQSINLLRILQEIITNAHKHGHPNKIEVFCEESMGFLNFIIINTGGEPFREVNRGYGIRNIKRRSKLFKQGMFEIIPLYDGAEVRFGFCWR